MSFKRNLLFIDAEDCLRIFIIAVEEFLATILRPVISILQLSLFANTNEIYAIKV